MARTMAPARMRQQRAQPLGSPLASRWHHHRARLSYSAVVTILALVSGYLWLFWEYAAPRVLELEDRIDLTQVRINADGIDLSTLMHIVMPPSPTMASDMAKMAKADMLDVLGMYTHLSGSPSQPNRSVYQRPLDPDVHMWHAEGSGWYCGPEKNLGTHLGMLHATHPSWTHQYKEPPGGLHEPIQDGYGWLAATGPRLSLEPTSIEVLNHVEYLAVMSRGARELQLWPAGRTPPLRFGIPSRNYLGGRQIPGTFTWDKSAILDGRPWYIMGRDAFQLGGKNLVLWYSSSLESWCVGMLDLSTLNLNEGMDTVLDEWDRCELRARDAALLPEWITQPWQMLDDERAFAQTRAKSASLYYGEIRVDNVPVRYVDAPSMVRVKQLPLQETPLSDFAEWWAPRLLATCLAVLLSLWFNVLRALARSWCDDARRRIQRMAQPKKAKPRRQKVVAGPTDEPQWWLELEELHDALDDAARAKRPEFICSISGEIMRNPALLSDGRAQGQFIYEHDHAKKWVDEHRTEPTTRAKLRDPKFALNGPLQREIKNWCEEQVALLQQGSVEPPPEPIARQSIHVFVDHSNVAIGAKRATGDELDVRRLVQSIEQRRDAKERVVVGSHHSERAGTEWKKLGYKMLADPRRGKEHFVDEALQAQLMRTAAKSFTPRRVLVLVTGDGNANEGRMTFPECVEAALKNNWQVELYSWRQALSQIYVDMAAQYVNDFSIHHIDDL